ncbi:MAG: peptidoglycan-binding protein [Phycisphaerae bacterium]
MCAQQYEVQPGDVIAQIAGRHGFRKWETVWEDAANKPLRDKRQNPNVLHPGDVIQIPDKTTKQVPCSTTMHHVFEAPVMRQILRIKVEEQRGQPMARKPYVLTIDGTQYPGETNEEGILQESIPVNASEGELEIEGCVWPLRVGQLNPVDEQTTDDHVSGAQGRLNNLGYGCSMSGELDDETRAAIKAFQADEGLETSGELDEQTRSALRQRHGC